MVEGKTVADVGCGFGHNKPIVEKQGGKWIGIEPFAGGAHTLVGDAQNLPLENNSVDIVIMEAVLHLIPEVHKAFAEVVRVLKPGGKFVGYTAYMECFNEISYAHLSFKTLEYYAKINNMKLSKLSGGSAFGIDYHLAVLLYPIPFKWGRRIISSSIRGIFRSKAFLLKLALHYVRKEPWQTAKERAHKYYMLECLRQISGFSFVIEKL